jgi:hypothetical protein
MYPTSNSCPFHITSVGISYPQKRKEEFVKNDPFAAFIERIEYQQLGHTVDQSNFFPQSHSIHHGFLEKNPAFLDCVQEHFGLKIIKNTNDKHITAVP